MPVGVLSAHEGVKRLNFVRTALSVASDPPPLPAVEGTIVCMVGAVAFAAAGRRHSGNRGRLVRPATAQARSAARPRAALRRQR